MKLSRLAFTAGLCLGTPAFAAPPTWVWEGPTPGQSAPLNNDEDGDGRPDPRPTEGTVVKVSSPKKMVATVYDRNGERDVDIPGSFTASGVVRIEAWFATDDYFEKVLLLPEGAPGQPVEVKIPDKKSQHLYAGGQRIPVSRGVKVVTFRDDPKALDIAAKPTADGMPQSGPRYSGPGKKGVDIRQVLFHVSGSNTVKETVDALLSRSLSTHLLVGQDGTIYQLLDLHECAYHAGEANMHSIGVDLVQRHGFFRYEGDMTVERYAKMKPAERERWRAEAKKHERSCPAEVVETEDDSFATDPREEDPGTPDNPLHLPNDLNLGQKDPRRIHPIVGPVEINGAPVRAYGPTPAAMESVVALSAALLHAFREIPRTVPSTFEGKPIMRKADDPRGFGLVGHWHWESQRWDPGPGFDWQALVNLLLTFDR